MSELIACPNCGSSEHLIEQQLRYTFQPVEGLKRDREVEEYDSFDWPDYDVYVCGYSCHATGCGWYAAAELSATEQHRIDSFVEQVLTSMPEAKA